MTTTRPASERHQGPPPAKKAPAGLPRQGRAGSPSNHARRNALRAAQKRRQRYILAGLASALVLIVVVVLVVVKTTTSTTATTSAAPDTPAPASALAALSGIPASSLAHAAQVTKVNGPTAINAPPLTQGGKPEILYMGAEYCPYCAAERWAIVTALSHFGHFSGLGVTTSSATDIDPSTPTFSFHGATYTSPYLAFSSVEETTNQQSGNGYVPLEQPTAAQQQLFTSYGNGGIPFLDLGGRYVGGVAYDPAVLASMSTNGVAAAAAQGSSTAGKDIQASAGVLTAAICRLTNNQPAAVCSAFAANNSGH